MTDFFKVEINFWTILASIYALWTLLKFLFPNLKKYNDYPTLSSQVLSGIKNGVKINKVFFTKIKMEILEDELQKIKNIISNSERLPLLLMEDQIITSRKVSRFKLIFYPILLLTFIVFSIINIDASYDQLIPAFLDYNKIENGNIIYMMQLGFYTGILTMIGTSLLIFIYVLIFENKSTHILLKSLRIINNPECISELNALEEEIRKLKDKLLDLNSDE